MRLSLPRPPSYWLGIGGAVVAVSALPLIVATFLSPPVFFTATQFGYPAAAAIAFAAAVVKLRRVSPPGKRALRRKRPSFDQAFGADPGRTLSAAFLVGIVGVIGWATGFVATGGGQAVVTPDGRYGINVHGSIRIVTHAEYLVAAAGATRLFMGWALVFLAISVPILLARPHRGS